MGSDRRPHIVPVANTCNGSNTYRARGCVPEFDPPPVRTTPDQPAATLSASRDSGRHCAKYLFFWMHRLPAAQQLSGIPMPLPAHFLYCCTHVLEPLAPAQSTISGSQQCYWRDHGSGTCPIIGASKESTALSERCARTLAAANLQHIWYTLPEGTKRVAQASSVGLSGQCWSRRGVRARQTMSEQSTRASWLDACLCVHHSKGQQRP